MSSNISDAWYSQCQVRSHKVTLGPRTQHSVRRACQNISWLETWAPLQSMMSARNSSSRYAWSCQCPLRTNQNSGMKIILGEGFEHQELFSKLTEIEYPKERAKRCRVSDSNAAFPVTPPKNKSNTSQSSFIGRPSASTRSNLVKQKPSPRSHSDFSTAASKSPLHNISVAESFLIFWLSPRQALIFLFTEERDFFFDYPCNDPVMLWGGGAVGRSCFETLPNIALNPPKMRNPKWHAAFEPFDRITLKPGIRTEQRGPSSNCEFWLICCTLIQKCALLLKLRNQKHLIWLHQVPPILFLKTVRHSCVAQILSFWSKSPLGGSKSPLSFAWTIPTIPSTPTANPIDMQNPQSEVYKMPKNWHLMAWASSNRRGGKNPHASIVRDSCQHPQVFFEDSFFSWIQVIPSMQKVACGNQPKIIDQLDHHPVMVRMHECLLYIVHNKQLIDQQRDIFAVDQKQHDTSVQKDRKSLWPWSLSCDYHTASSCWQWFSMSYPLQSKSIIVHHGYSLFSMQEEDINIKALKPLMLCWQKKGHPFSKERTHFLEISELTALTLTLQRVNSCVLQTRKEAIFNLPWQTNNFCWFVVRWRIGFQKI